MDESKSLPDEDAVLQQIHSDVQSYGWCSRGVIGESGDPDWAYSIGLYQTYRHPEVAVFGLDHETMFGMIDVIAELIRDGQRFDDGTVSADVLDGYKCAFQQADRQRYQTYFGKALDYYQRSDFPLVQCIWPDRQGRFPWDAGFEEHLRGLQPRLSTDD